MRERPIAPPDDAEAFANANGIRLCYETFGDRAHAPLVLIMGLGAQMVVWDDDFCLMLAARGFWVIRFDNRDIGRSTTFPNARTPSIAALVLSQATAQEMAIHFPARVRTLTSLMSSTGDPKLPGPERKALAALAKKTPLDRAGYVRNFVEIWAVIAGDGLPFDRERMARQGAASYDRGSNPPGVPRQMLAIIASGNRKKALRGIRTPTLVIHGTRDPLIPFAAGIDTAHAIPGAELLAIDGMGHWLPREVWPRIVDAIARHAAAASSRSS